MFRTTLAAIALIAVMSTNASAGCGCGSAVHAGGDCCDSGCGSSCGVGLCGGGCGGACGNRCGFPIVRGALRVVGKVVSSIIPHPCRRRGCCGTVASCGTCNTCGCGGETANWDPHGGSEVIHNHGTVIESAPMYQAPTPAPRTAPRTNGGGDPFQDDPPAAMQKREARAPRTSAPVVTNRPTGVIKPSPYKSAAAPTPAKKAGLSVLKVSHDVELQRVPTPVAAADDYDAPPAAPISIRSAKKESVVRDTMTVNPLRR